MTTYNVNSSCEVLWVSRQSNEQVQALFSKTTTIFVRNLKDVVDQLVQAGAQWLSSDFGKGTYDDEGANYLYPDGAAYSDVVQCTWSKDTTSPAGVFQLQLKPRIPYNDMINPGDIMLVFMDDDHQYGPSNRTHGTLETIGIVDGIGDSTATDGEGATIQTVSVNGRDLGKIFQETETVFDKALAAVEQQFFDSKYVTRISEGDVSAQSPVEVVMTILNLIFNQNATGSTIAGLQWTLPNSTDSSGRPTSLLSLINISDFVQVPMCGYALSNSLGIAQAGNVWTLMESYANRVVNEFFVDVRDLSRNEFDLLDHMAEQATALLDPEDVVKQRAVVEDVGRNGIFNQSTLRLAAEDAVEISTPVMALVHRQMPFDRDAFKKLPYNELRYDETFAYDVRRTSHDVVNYFKVRFPDLPESFQELTYGLKINLESIARFGVRRLEAESRYCFTSSKASTNYSDGNGSVGDFVDPIKFYVGLLSTWNAANDAMLAGEIGCRFRPEIRCGTRLKNTAVPLDDEQGDQRQFSFYVQGVNQTFSVTPGASRTSLTVVRGIEENAGGLPNNLIWVPRGTPDGNQIPSSLATFRTTSTLESL